MHSIHELQESRRRMKRSSERRRQRAEKSLLNKLRKKREAADGKARIERAEVDEDEREGGAGLSISVSSQTRSRKRLSGNSYGAVPLHRRHIVGRIYRAVCLANFPSSSSFSVFICG